MSEPRAIEVHVDEKGLTVHLADGRRLTVPLAGFPRLQTASGEQRGNWRLIGDGEWICSEDVDEHLSVAGLLRGNPAPAGSVQAG